MNASFIEVASSLLSEGRAVRFRAHGGSMRPLIRAGDILEVQPLDGQAVRRGDVLLYRLGDGRPVAHRVVRISYENGRPAFLVQGDAFIARDRPVFPEQVLGRLAAVERGGRRLRLDSPRQKLFASIWLALVPFRPMIFQAWAAFRRAYRKVKIARNIRP